MTLACTLAVSMLASYLTIACPSPTPCRLCVPFILRVPTLRVIMMGAFFLAFVVASAPSAVHICHSILSSWSFRHSLSPICRPVTSLGSDMIDCIGDMVVVRQNTKGRDKDRDSESHGGVLCNDEGVYLRKRMLRQTRNELV